MDQNLILIQHQQHQYLQPLLQVVLHKTREVRVEPFHLMAVQQLQHQVFVGAHRLRQPLQTVKQPMELQLVHLLVQLLD